MKHALYKRFAQIGPGGMKCHCCGPAPGREKAAAKRIWKRREKAAVRRETMNELKT